MRAGEDSITGWSDKVDAAQSMRACGAYAWSSDRSVADIRDRPKEVPVLNIRERLDAQHKHSLSREQTIWSWAALIAAALITFWVTRGAQ
jgi:hypothetical protein